jgi:hypothetical protein
MKMTGSDGSQQVNGLSSGLVRELQRRVSWRDFTLAGRGMVVDQCFYYLLVSTHHYGNRHVSVHCVYPCFPKINSGPILTRYASAVWILKPCQMTQCLCVPQQTSAKAPAYINPPTFNIPVQVNLFSLSSSSVILRPITPFSPPRKSSYTRRSRSDWNFLLIPASYPRVASSLLLCMSYPFLHCYEPRSVSLSSCALESFLRRDIHVVSQVHMVHWVER